MSNHPNYGSVPIRIRHHSGKYLSLDQTAGSLVEPKVLLVLDEKAPDHFAKEEHWSKERTIFDIQTWFLFEHRSTEFIHNFNLMNRHSGLLACLRDRGDSSHKEVIQYPVENIGVPYQEWKIESLEGGWSLILNAHTNKVIAPSLEPESIDYTDHGISFSRKMQPIIQLTMKQHQANYANAKWFFEKVEL